MDKRCLKGTLKREEYQMVRNCIKKELDPTCGLGNKLTISECDMLADP